MNIYKTQCVCVCVLSWEFMKEKNLKNKVMYKGLGLTTQGEAQKF